MFPGRAPAAKAPAAENGDTAPWLTGLWAFFRTQQKPARFL